MLPRSPRARVASLVATAALALGGLAATGTGTVAPVGTAAAATTSTARTTVPAADPAADRTLTKKAKDPRKTRGLFVDQRMPAFTQGEVRHAPIAKKAQALWLGIEYYGTPSVRGVVQQYTDLAVAARKTPVLVVYSIPDRDCDQYSAGGAADGPTYQGWVKQVAAGIGSSKPLVIVEPDAIPFIGDPGCDDVADRLALLRFAVKRLAAAGAWVYLDAGHSGWTPYDGRAALLKRAGVGFGRGIATNVSNFRALADEKAYGTLLRKELKKLGVTGVKQVVDTSRNGARNPVAGDVINPTWARVGKAPKLVFDGGLDGTLWVKHPGESDGPLNGGPASGVWCDLLADRLLGLAERPGC
ncbi:glycoside hydrolase family 6 protein [Nocardioides abyssi]|uniref:Glucanase n=1 Tax=Nocardioides abyssi TaxID=3058370 RepID=A0ABT8ESF7_9ACTN|nr:glycoside hydrolase family 6 protein [Nocardioides abyssi]MDN4161054.1 glycoside hydrolase family 6 protein [Nocardioides abyssi]